MSNRRRTSLIQRAGNILLIGILAVGIGYAISHFNRTDNENAGRMTAPRNEGTDGNPDRPVRIQANRPSFDTDAARRSEGADPLTFERLAFIDPAAAARGIAGLTDGKERDEKLMILLRTWSDTDPAAAADWAADLPMGSFRVEALARVAALWTDRDREAVQRWLQLQQPPSHFLPVWNALAMGWSSTDPEAALNWSLRIQDEEARARAEAGIARQLAVTDPDFARDWLTTITDPAKFDRLATHFVTAWAAEDPAATAAWLDGGLLIQNEAFHRKAALLLAAHWTASDPRAAGEWINQLSDGSLREDAKFAFAQSLSATEPTIALAWAESIANPGDRRDTVLGIYEDWLTADPDTFKTALIERWPKETDPVMRQSIYQILYDSDEAFQKEVFSLLEGFIYPEEDPKSMPTGTLFPEDR